MKKSDYLSKKLETIEVGSKSVSELLRAMSNTGFQGKQLGNALDVWEAMASDPKVTIFMGYAGSMSTTGQWKMIKWLIEHRYIDVLVSTGANISEDIFEAMGNKYYQGTHTADDADLLKNQIDRFYDVYADEMDYRRLEGLIREFIEKKAEKGLSYSSAQFLHEFGKFQEDRKIHSISAAAYKEGVPIFSPGMADSGYGVAAFQAFKNGVSLDVNQFKDFYQLGRIGEESKDTAVVYVGGGVPKDTIQLVTIMVDLSRGGETVYPHKYAIQLTADSPQWGGLSGCTFEEAVSWGKIGEKAKRAVCYCDATIALPLLVHGLNERLGGKKRKPAQDFAWMWKD
ncbi:MAG: deoxyhypusine synthase [Candidatus Micrarchaeota archaeon]|nr:deoxyhypusine synthase [Candidatus Micrarchaeota archaeon]